MAQLFKFEGKLYKEAPEQIDGGCTGCAFDTAIGSCQKFCALYSSVSCVCDNIVFIEYKEKSDAPS